ncbi:tagaturonate reductase [Flavobacterium sp. TP390]|uniref:Tagaturonate reductase n=1 Tax=Flavobacterium profundi TaxID=1774945 RepID=A0A6I4IEY7_9FLAO|nr:tagaturonate reductase [Flavobacterium profundi]MVO08273.1 tagaturonate reductase [Flavobacterium profundi]
MENTIKQKLNRVSIQEPVSFPIKVVQFGEGNFLRAFVDYAFQRLNTELNFNAGIAVVQPLAGGVVHMLNDQDGLYTLFMNGVKKGEKIQDIALIKNVVKGINPYTEFKSFIALAKEEELQFIISNTTEAGIEFVATDLPTMEPPASFPAKLAILLHERFQHFKGDFSKGVTIIPCELINYNAATLKNILLQYCDLWNLDNTFKTWLLEACTYHNTLVDRIVPGYPKNEIEEYDNKLNYSDNLIVTAEPFFLWVIEGDEALKQKLPFHKTDLNVKIVEDMQDFRTLKVRILNGAHTAMVPFSILYGNQTVRETVDGTFTGNFVDSVLHEINSTLDMNPTEITNYVEEVMDRFRNPFIIHKLSDIALNTVSKFKVRVLPSLLTYVTNTQELPLHLTFSLACLIQFYKGDWNGKALPINDNAEIISFFNKLWKTNDLPKIVNSTLENKDFWECNLLEVKGLAEAVVTALSEIETNGIDIGFENFKMKFNS